MLARLAHHLATALCRARNAWWQVSTEERRLRTALVWAHATLAEDVTEPRALWVMYFLGRALRRGADLDEATAEARWRVYDWQHKGAGDDRADDYRARTPDHHPPSDGRDRQAARGAGG